MKKEAMFYEKLGGEKNKDVQCQLCPNFCIIKPGEIGKCRVRQNQKGRLISLNYNRPCSLQLDPIEKKPLYHFLPGKKTLSIATAGCNLRCKYCQNSEISQFGVEETRSLNISSEKIIKEAKKQKAKIISYTYTEPTIFYEYMLDTAKSARKSLIRNVSVTNGFINPGPLKHLCKYLDGSNIDLKSMSNDFYKDICEAKLEPVLNSIKIMKKQEVWIELTNLLIPGLNDSEENINKLVEWVKKNLGRDIPLHFTAFYPTYKILNLPPTSIKTLKKARRLAMSRGINYAYTGNLPDDEGNHTYCPKCREIVIKRKGFSVIENNLKNGRCKFCDAKIAGVWN